MMGSKRTALGSFFGRLRSWIPVVALCAAGAMPAIAQETAEDFEDWSIEGWTTTTQADGWAISDAQIMNDFRHHPPYEGILSAWLRDFASSTNSWVRTPLIASGAGTVAYAHAWFAHIGYSGTGTNWLTVEYSTNLVDWVPVATTASTSEDWAVTTNAVGVYAPASVRLRKTGELSSIGLQLGLDDIRIAPPPAVKLGNLRHAPASPTADDDLNLLIDLVGIHPLVTSVVVTARYRFDETGPFASRPMAAWSNNTYTTDGPLSNGRAGTLEYYVQVVYAGISGPTILFPEDGADAPARVIITGPGGVQPDPRQLGPCNRRSGLSITEIMYHPAARQDGRDLEFIEIYNSEPFFHDLSGYRLSGEVDFTFPADTVLEGQSHLVVAAVPQDITYLHPVSYVLGPYSNRLSNGGGVARLRNASDAVLVEAAYSDNASWPVQADGAGHSLVLAEPDRGEDARRAWAPGARMDGSPGRPDFGFNDGLSEIVINEFLAHTDLPQVDFVELHNRGTQAVNVGGCVLTDDVTTNRFVLPPGATVPARGFLAFDQNEMGFSLSMHGDDLFLIDTNAGRVVDGLRFAAQANGVASGRYPDGGREIRVLASPTQGNANSGPAGRDVVISEIMYHPISEDADDEYIEIHNQGTGTVDLGYWQFTDGIAFTFPEGKVLAPGGYLVVARNAAHLIARYPQLNAANTLGNYGGTLSDRGERVVLARPDDLQLPFEDLVTVDTVEYGDGERWGEWADGGGSSLELIDPRSDNRRAMNWAGSDETAKANWTLIEHTGTLDNGNDGISEALREVQLLLLEEGECLLDDIDVHKSGGGNLVSGGTFESGLSGWVLQGNHERSSLETTQGFESSQSLHVRASGDGDNGANRIEVNIASGLNLNETGVTVRAMGRWLAGHRDVLLRLQGNHLEAAGTLDVPTDLGTPGLPNSRAVGNAGPAIYDVAHAPLLPEENEDVVVSAVVQDPDGIASVTCRYRVDPNTTQIALTMNDSGVSGDRLAGDGTYSATLPGKAANITIAFHVEAMDAHAQSVSTTFPSDAPVRECHVMFGQSEPAGAFGSYRLWVTEATRADWDSDHNYSNEPRDATVIYSGVRAIYNAGVRFRGSSFIRRGYGNPETADASYAFKVSKDDRLLGADGFNLDRLERDSSYQSERTSFWIGDKLGVPFSYQRYLHVYINEFHKGTIYSDSHYPNRGYISSWFPDDNEGDLFEIDDWFEYDDSLNFSSVNATIADFTTTGGAKKQARYRWNWEKKPAMAADDGYEGIFAVADAMNLPLGRLYDARVNALIDIEQWMRTMGTRRIVGDWDGYGYNRGKNTYTYKPVRAPWNLLLWDLDFSLGAGSRAATHGLFDQINDAVLRDRFFVHPRSRRAYWRALEDAVNGPLVAGNHEPMMWAFYDALASNGVAVASPTDRINWMATRRAYISSQLGSVTNVAFEVSTEDFASASSPVTITGTAPVAAYRVHINGIEHPVYWTTETAWEATVALVPGANVLQFSGVNNRAESIGSDWVTVTHTGTNVSPAGYLVINEIMYHAPSTAGDFVEIHNLSSVHTFPLEGLRIDGIDFTFAPGTFIGPTGFVVVADNAAVYQAVYGNAEVLTGSYPGDLDNGGETLRLLMPAGTSTWIVIDEVRYDDDLPWPPDADGLGASLQLIDATRDNNRIGNWGAMPLIPSSLWQSAALTGQSSADPGEAANATLHLYLGAAGEVVVDDVRLVEGSVPSAGTNLLGNAGFETELSGPWAALGNHDGSSITNTPVHAGTGSLRLAGIGPGEAGRFPDSVSQGPLGLAPSTTYTVSFWYNPTASSQAMTAELKGSDILLSRDTRYLPAPVVASTPGEANNIAAALPPFPLLWLNEVMPSNVSYEADNHGEFEPWVELYNADLGAIDLGDGYYLSDDAANPAKWAFPTGHTVDANDRLVVWTDGETAETAPGFLHAGFRINSVSGCVFLAREVLGNILVLDALCYDAIGPDFSYGSYPDGDPSARQVFHSPSAGQPNSPTSQVVMVRINEWMADNDSTLPDPADAHFEDWFELYNAGGLQANLGGYTLSDDLEATNRFTIPGGTLLPAGAYMLVWADNEPGQNAPGGDLHVDFKLDKGGDAIALFAPDGSLVDAVTFGTLASDEAGGRWPDGSGWPYRMVPATPGAPNRVLLITALTGQRPQPVTISWDAELGVVYRVDWRDAMNAGAWAPLGTVTALTTSVNLSDTNGMPDGKRFYRLLRQE